MDDRNHRKIGVSKDTGAGLEMTAHSYGYHVDSVEDQPGQDLKPGDVLLLGTKGQQTYHTKYIEIYY